MRGSELTLSSSTLPRWLAGAAVCATLAACTCDPTGVRELRFACTQDAECAADFVCTQGVCVSRSGAGGGGGGGGLGGGAGGGGLNEGGGGGSDFDAGDDAGIDDAGADAGSGDAGTSDAGTDAGVDAGPVDAGYDAGQLSFGFTNLPQSIVQGACSPPLNLELRDGLDASYPAPGPITVSLTSAPAGLTYSTVAGCGVATTQVFLDAGQSSTTFRFTGTVVGGYSVGATAPGITGTSQAGTVTLAPATTVTFASAAQTVQAGQCARLDVEIRSAFGLVPGARTINFSAAPAGLSFFSDATCTTASASASTGAGATASIYVRAATGQPYTVTAASAGLTSAVQTHTVLPVVRRGSCTLGAAAFTVNCPIAPAQIDTTHTLLTYALSANTVETGEASVLCLLTNTTTIACTRLSIGSQVTVAWQTAELYSGLRVERAVAICDGGSQTTLTIPAVTPAQSFVFSSQNDDGNGLNGSDFTRAVLQSATQVLVDYSGPCGNSQTVGVQVAQLTGVNIDRGTTNIGQGSLSRTVSALPALDGGGVVSYSMTVGAATNPRLCDRVIQGDVVGSTQVQFTRGLGAGIDAGCEEATVNNLSYERIDFAARARVVPQTFNLSGGTGTASAAFLATVDATRTLAFTGGNWGAGQSMGSSDHGVINADNMGAVSGALTLTPGGAITATGWQVARGSTLGAASFRAFAIEFNP